MSKPVFKSLHEFTDYLATHLSYVRHMRRLSRDDPYFAQWDEVMGQRWCSVINGRSPSPEQRKAALEERQSVQNLLPRIQPATRELLVRLHSLQAYANALPLPAAASGGWDLRADLLHPDNIMKMINAAMDDAKSFHYLCAENEYFKLIFDQLIEMARWTRTSLNPGPEDRAKVQLGQVTQEMLDIELKNVLTNVCRSMHDFLDLYANYPAQAPMPKMHLEPINLTPRPPGGMEMPDGPSLPETNDNPPEFYK